MKYVNKSNYDQLSECIRCIVCGSERLVIWLRLGNHNLVRCKECDYVCFSPLHSQEELDTYMQAAYQGEGLEETKGMFAHCGKGYGDDPVIREYKETLDKLAFYTEGRQLLDVGCGPGTFLDIAHQNGWAVLGMDSCPSACAFAEKEFGLRVLCPRLEDVFLHGRLFDVITMWDFLEHVLNPLAVVAKANSVLKDQGLLLLSVPNRCSVIYRIATILIKLNAPSLHHHARKLFHFSHGSYFSLDSIQNVLQRTGFRIVEKRFTDPYLGRYQIPWYSKCLLQAVFYLSRLFNAQSRMLIIARKERDVGDTASR